MNLSFAQLQLQLVSFSLLVPFVYSWSFFVLEKTKLWDDWQFLPGQMTPAQIYQILFSSHYASLHILNWWEGSCIESNFIFVFILLVKAEQRGSSIKCCHAKVLNSSLPAALSVKWMAESNEINANSSQLSPCWADSCPSLAKYD